MYSYDIANSSVELFVSSGDFAYRDWIPPLLIKRTGFCSGFNYLAYYYWIKLSSSAIFSSSIILNHIGTIAMANWSDHLPQPYNLPVTEIFKLEPLFAHWHQTCSPSVVGSSIHDHHRFPFDGNLNSVWKTCFLVTSTNSFSMVKVSAAQQQEFNRFYSIGFKRFPRSDHRYNESLNEKNASTADLLTFIGP